MARSTAATTISSNEPMGMYEVGCAAWCPRERRRLFGRCHMGCLAPRLGETARRGPVCTRYRQPRLPVGPASCRGPSSRRSRAMKEHVLIPSEAGLLDGTLERESRAFGVVVFIHGSGSNRTSPRNEYVADRLRQ